MSRDRIDLDNCSFGCPHQPPYHPPQDAGITLEATQIGVKEASAQGGLPLSEAKMVSIANTILTLLCMQACPHGHVKAAISVFFAPPSNS